MLRTMNSSSYALLTGRHTTLAALTASKKAWTPRQPHRPTLSKADMPPATVPMTPANLALFPEYLEYRKRVRLVEAQSELDRRRRDLQARIEKLRRIPGRSVDGFVRRAEEQMAALRLGTPDDSALPACLEDVSVKSWMVFIATRRSR
jgi:hypothetical protein